VTVDHIIGAVLGGAIGDGWGGPYEGGVPHGPARAPGQLVISDDTQLTLATCEAIVEAREIAPERIAARFLAWYRTGKLRGLGASTMKALRDLDAGAHWALAGAKGERSAGNGAAMRIAPLAFLLDPADDGDRRTLRDVCRITHHHEEAYVGALAIVAAIRLVSSPGGSAAGLLTDVAAILPDSQVRDRLLRYAGFPDSVSVSQIADTWGSSGFVADSVPLALFAAREIGSRPFVDVIEGVVQAGGDTDTIASMTGQIAGAAVGSAGLPAEMLVRLQHGEAIGATARAFAGVCLSG
jgi:ADP-ribosyl-[dinitrogen reductase] hydrolase